MEKEKVKIVVPLKYLINFWRALVIPLINCEVPLTLTLSANCVLTNKVTRDADPDANPINATFKITDTKSYVPVVVLSIQD